MGYFTDRLNQDQGITPPAPLIAEPKPEEQAPPEKGFFTKKLAEEAPSFAPPAVTAETPWSDVLEQGAKGFAKDIPRTALEIAGGLGHAIAHPIDTATGIGKLATGTYDYLAGNETPEAKMAQQVGSQLKHDYLTEEGWKQGIAERPFSRALDVGSLLIAPEFTAEKAGLTGAAKALKMANPATWMVKGGQQAVVKTDNLLNHIAGHFGTYTGGETLNIIRDAAFKGGKDSEAALRAMSGTEDATNLVGDLRKALRGLREEERNIPYRRGMNLVHADTQILDQQPVIQSLHDINRRFNTYINPTSPSQAALDTAETRNALNNTVLDHFMQGHNTNDPVFFQPTGFDDLKLKINAIARDAPNEQSRAAAYAVRDAITKEIKSKSPEYARTMENYERVNSLVDELEKELSLGANGNPSTALRKVLSAMRNNVTGNFTRRKQLLETLTNRPGMSHILPSLAGQIHSSMWPRTLAGSFMSSLLGEGALYGMLSHFTPLGYLGSAAVIPAHIGMSSPYLMGRFAHAQGVLGRHLSKIPGRPLVYTGKTINALSPYMTNSGE